MSKDLAANLAGPDPFEVLAPLVGILALGQGHNGNDGDNETETKLHDD